MNRLIDKFLNGTISHQERSKLKKMLENEENRTGFESYLRNQADVYTTLQNVDSDDAFDMFWMQITNGKVRPYRRFSFQVLKYAAVFIGLICFGYAIYNSTRITPLSNLSREHEENLITLELEDGLIKVLDENATEIISNSKNEKIVNHSKNTLLYDKGMYDNEEKLVYNQLDVPYGKKFQLTLSDGSHIFLNSGSRLRYPVKFIKGLDRNVYLDGEAFFEVAKDSAHPFTVVTTDMNTVVLGTKFNVSSYKNDNQTFTVLLEGSVGVYEAKREDGLDDDLAKIVPGQRATYESEKVIIDEVDVHKYIAWTQGKLHFVNDRFDIITKELERHFDVKIINEYSSLNEKPITGTFETETLTQILEAFKAHSDFEYILDKKTILITKP